ncbi:hypothetical protein ACHHYP_01398 [Achlya hypogyna]|uniref:PX domain-containing protein n=1 Tax=Achlya hypogyna TaxID=1202772 RepID=A0A1V9Z8R0_ACHHY|nr:hypothetical protein ACHHYP_01398 [Achlya hypogyna]
MVSRIEHVTTMRAKVASVTHGPDNVVYYIVHVERGAEAWQVSRRYSDFRQLYLGIQHHFLTAPDECHADIVTDLDTLEFPKRKVFHPHGLAQTRLDALRSFLKLLMIALHDELCDSDLTCPAAMHLSAFLRTDVSVPFQHCLSFAPHYGMCRLASRSCPTILSP